MTRRIALALGTIAAAQPGQTAAPTYQDETVRCSETTTVQGFTSEHAALHLYTRMVRTQRRDRNASVRYSDPRTSIRSLRACT